MAFSAVIAENSLYQNGGFMLYLSALKSQLTIRAAAYLMAGFAFAASPSLASVCVEGHLPGIKTDGRYDFDVEIRSRASNAGEDQSPIIQSVLKVRVVVTGGRFQLELDTGMELAHPLSDMIITAKVRPFESGKPFTPAVVSRVYTLVTHSTESVAVRSSPTNHAGRFFPQ